MDEKNYKVELPKFISMNRNLMWVPTSVLNPKAAFSQKSIFTAWSSFDQNTKIKMNHSFEFSSIHDNPLPLAEHSKILDILLAIYANNITKDDPENMGGLHFKMCDVAEVSGRKYTEGFRKSLAESIYRYMRCVAFWHNAYLSNGMRGNLSCTLIEESSIWDQYAGRDAYEKRVRISKDSSRNNRAITSWHYIKFNQRIAKILHEGDTRLFLSELIKSDLRPLPYIVYRYFYAFSDLKPVERSLAQLKQTFSYGSRGDFFLIWLREQLEEIAKFNLIDNYEWPTKVENWNEAIVKVKCKSFIKTNNMRITIDIEKLRNIDTLPSNELEEIKKKFIEHNLLSDESLAAIQSIQSIASKEIYQNMLRNMLKACISKFDLF